MHKHYLMTDQSGISALSELAAPEFSAADYAGWEGLSAEAGGVFFFMFKISADAVEYPMHASPDEWLGYVVVGEGELFSGNASGEKLGSVSFKAGDFITFMANTQHAWKNGGQESKILFVKKA